MTPEDEKRILEWRDDLGGAVSVTLRTTSDERTAAFEGFCSALVGLVPQLTVVTDDGELGELPAVVLGDGAVTYHAVPEGTKLPPFLDVVLSLSGVQPAEAVSLDAYGDASDRLNAMGAPALVSLFVMPQCPFCPMVTRQALALVAASDQVRLSVIDGSLFPELAEAEGIRSAPTVLLDRRFRWTGRLNLGEVLEAMTQRDPAELSPDVLEGMLKAGDGSRLIEMMLEREMVFPGLIDLLAQDKIFVRVGAMMVMEEIADRRKDIAAQAADALWHRFSKVKDPVKGDILHVLGEIGDERFVPMMKEIRDADHHEDVKDAAREAIKKLMPAARG